MILAIAGVSPVTFAEKGSDGFARPPCRIPYARDTTHKLVALHEDRMEESFQVQ